ncbi:MAG TPA: chromate transporter [Chthonomonadaceae bacterium]|nr:chromate transporter [Chthonomonadaceae bacterium]
MNPLQYFLLALKASMLSTGGFGNVPSLHDDLLARNWATERTFSESLAVGQVSPGPNGLWIISLGYFVDGVRGALLSLAAITIPPILILAVDWLYHRTKHLPAVDGFIRGLGLATTGIFFVVLQRLLHDAGLNARTLAICAASCAIGLTRRVPVAAVLLVAAVIGLLLGRR